MVISVITARALKQRVCFCEVIAISRFLFSFIWNRIFLWNIFIRLFNNESFIDHIRSYVTLWYVDILGYVFLVTCINIDRVIFCCTRSSLWRQNDLLFSWSTVIIICIYVVTYLKVKLKLFFPIMFHEMSLYNHLFSLVT